jgi:cytochrome c553
MTTSGIQKTIVFIIFLGMGWSVFSAETPVVKSNSVVSEPDIKAGELIASKGTSTGVAACFACHGMKGSENMTGSFPRIAGQSSLYLVNQLKDYSSGIRGSDVMENIAKGLKPEEMESVAAYYASLEMAPMKAGKKMKPADLKRAETLAKTGDMKLQLQACNNCHGPGGIGMGPAIPYLAGQFGPYIDAQLKLWKNDKRKNSPDQMIGIAKKLSDKDIAILSAYFESVKR